MFDLDSDPILISGMFSENHLLTRLMVKISWPSSASRWDSFETAVCAILGQLVSIEYARQMIRQLVENYGEKVTNPLTGEGAFLFPSPEVLAKASLEEVGTTKARKETIRIFAREVLERKSISVVTKISIFLEKKF